MDLNIRHTNTVKIIELAGSMDWASSAHIRNAMLAATAEKPARVVINMNRVNTLDAGGLSVLVLGLKWARENKGDLCLCELQSSVRMIFELTRFDKMFEIYISEEDAILAVSRHD